MKRTSYALIALLVLIGGTSVNSRGSLESLVPAETRAFLKSAPIGKVIKSVNTFINTALTPDQKKDFMVEINKLKAETGIDPLNEGSLKRIGFDTSLPLGFAYIEGKPGPEKMIILLPVLNSKAFPLKFIEIMKNTKKGKKKDMNPVITQYRNNRIYQVQKDMFCGAIDRYFFMTSQGELARQIIDLSEAGGKSLASEDQYQAFLDKIDKNADMAFYMNKVFLGEAFGAAQKGLMRKKHPGNNRRHEGMRGTNEKNYNIIPAQYGGTPYHRGTPYHGGTPYGMRHRRGPSPMDAVDFAAMTLSLRASGISVSLGSQLNDSNPMVTAALDILKTGMAEFSLYPKMSYVYGHAALDLKKLDTLCPGPLPVCGEYNQMQMQLKRQIGADYKRDVLPAIKGSFNVIMDTMNMNDMVVFVPYENAGRGRVLFAKVKSHMRKTMLKKKKFGAARIAGKHGFWLLERQNKKIYFVQDAKGLYVSNNILSLKKALRYKTVKHSRGRGMLLQKLNGKVFLMAFIKKNPFLGSLLATKVPADKMKQMTTSIGDIYLSGSKSGKYLNVELDVAVKPAMR